MTGPEPCAWLHHEWNAGGTLSAYPPETAEENRAGDLIHHRLYGVATTSPATPYICIWRDSARGTVQDRKLGWPSRILLVASFGTEPWQPPRDLVEEATLRQMRDEGQLRTHWEWQDDGYRLSELGIELRKGGEARPFRSFHRGEEIATLDIAFDPIGRPGAPDEPIAFRLSGQVRERYNAGEQAKGDAVRLAIMGTARPMPPWLMY
ncbi:hypothetical protein WAB17_04715 [Parerythrobacter aurantius]|uniref:hypothetical protein n=1 Tax=Parerythrobacter aurantius TaxID=3127706 RepID=UPI003243E778